MGIVSKLKTVVSGSWTVKHDTPPGMIPRESYARLRRASTGREYGEVDVQGVANRLKAALNHSRKLYGKTVHHPKALFHAIDDHKTGCITTDELNHALYRLDIGLQPIQIQVILQVLDVNGSGAIELDEFLKLFEGRQPKKKSSYTSAYALHEHSDKPRRRKKKKKKRKKKEKQKEREKVETLMTMMAKGDVMLVKGDNDSNDTTDATSKTNSVAPNTFFIEKTARDNAAGKFLDDSLEVDDTVSNGTRSLGGDTDDSNGSTGGGGGGGGGGGHKTEEEEKKEDRVEDRVESIESILDHHDYHDDSLTIEAAKTIETLSEAWRKRKKIDDEVGVQIVYRGSGGNIQEWDERNEKQVESWKDYHMDKGQGDAAFNDWDAYFGWLDSVGEDSRAHLQRKLGDMLHKDEESSAEDEEEESSSESSSSSSRQQPQQLP